MRGERGNGCNKVCRFFVVHVKYVESGRVQSFGVCLAIAVIGKSDHGGDDTSCSLVDRSNVDLGKTIFFFLNLCYLIIDTPRITW